MVLEAQEEGGRASGSHSPSRKPHMGAPTGRATKQRVMLCMCEEHRALACKSCTGHLGVRHCCPWHRPGHPTGAPLQLGAWFGQGWCTQAAGGGGQERAQMGPWQTRLPRAHRGPPKGAQKSIYGADLQA